MKWAAVSAMTFGPDASVKRVKRADVVQVVHALADVVHAVN